MPVSKKEMSDCPIDAMLSVVDGRWKGTILWRLSDGPLRTSELHRSIPGISERMLIRHLQDLVPVLEAICAWGRTHLQRLNRAR